MESLEREKLKTRKELEKDHPLLSRKFSSIEEYSRAKVEYILRDKPASYWDDIVKAIKELEEKENTKVKQ